MENIIQTQSLVRTFKKVRAVDGLDLSISKGSIFGLVGPDGAGKTTTLRLLAGLLEISGGSGSVAGFDLKKQAEAIKPHIGYMAQQFSLYGDLSVWENLAFFADLYGVRGEARRQRTARLLEFARLTEFRDRRAAHLSGGMQKKLALACTLIHQPEILLLDEPTTGVDPVSRREFWDILAELNLDGTTILVSTPYMDEAERCHQVGLMFRGKLVRCDSPRGILASIPGELIELRPADWQATHRALSALPGVLEVQTYGDLMRVFLDSVEQRLPQVRRTLKEHQLAYQDLRPAPMRMEEAFISLIGTLEE